MNAAWLFVVGLIVAITASALTLAYLRRPLFRILVDLCGTEDRAAFWLAFSNVTLFLVPVLFALHSHPASGSFAESVLGIGDQLEAALLGLVVSVVALGLVLSRFIPRNDLAGRTKEAAAVQR
jgi:uncharacterized membrane protein YhaH (DUF805 family)